MPREKRQKALFSTYHVIVRGIEKKDIFKDDLDNRQFLYILKYTKEKISFKLEAFCLMKNHAHLVIHDNGNDISQIMKIINTTYAQYFNKKYERVGHLFQDRFKSKLIEDDIYLITTITYIHNNPVKANIVELPEQYSWSSFNEYVNGTSIVDGLLDKNRVLGILSDNLEKAKKELYKITIHYQLRNEDIFDIEEDLHINNNIEIAKAIVDEMNQKMFNLSAKEKKHLRNTTVRLLKEKYNLSYEQIGRLMDGISKAGIYKIFKSSKG